MKKGKLDLKVLKEIISSYTGISKKETLISSSIGEDCCLIDLNLLNEDVLMISSDPITFTSKNIGKLAVIINTNDIYATGGIGYGIIVNVLIPTNKTIDDFKIVMKDIHEECIKHNLQILGGHTEITDVVNDIVVSVTILGICNKNNVVNTCTSKKQDLIFLTKTLGIEGTVVLFDENKKELESILNDEEIKEIENFREKISIKNECTILRNFKINSMHDITEGGLIGALLEMSTSSNKGFKIYKDKIQIHNITKKICDYLNKDVYHLISSGNLLFTCEKDQEKLIKEGFKNSNIECNVIGYIDDKGKYYLDNNKIMFDISDSFFN